MLLGMLVGNVGFGDLSLQCFDVFFVVETGALWTTCKASPTTNDASQ